MERYLRLRPLRQWMDGAGLHLLLIACSIGWFVYLWGTGLPSLLAGLAFSWMLCLALARGRKSRLARKESVLRARLGGELVLEDLLLCPQLQADLRCAVLLSRRYPLRITDVTDAGVLCHEGAETLLIRCLRLPDSCETDARDIPPFARQVREAHAQRGVLCVTGGISRQAAAFAEACPVPVTLLCRATLLSLAGEACPAGDDQLAVLGKRRRHMPVKVLASFIVRPEKAARYLWCGLGLTGMYLLTHLKWYPAPAMVCLTLAALCRVRSAPPEKL